MYKHAGGSDGCPGCVRPGSGGSKHLCRHLHDVQCDFLHDHDCTQLYDTNLFRDAAKLDADGRRGGMHRQRDHGDDHGGYQQFRDMGCFGGGQPELIKRKASTMLKKLPIIFLLAAIGAAAQIACPSAASNSQATCQPLPQ